MKASSKRFAAAAAVLLAGAAQSGDMRAARVIDQPRYRVANLPSLGGTISRGNSIDDRGWAAGYSNLAGNQKRHATLWIDPQVLQFKAVLWGPEPNGIQTQVVGISGKCDQAVGRFTAIHAVLWEKGGVTDIGNLGRLSWNTPMALNEGGDIVGFAPVDDTDPDNPQLHAFARFHGESIQDLGALTGDLFSERRWESMRAARSSGSPAPTRTAPAPAGPSSGRAAR